MRFSRLIHIPILAAALAGCGGSSGTLTSAALSGAVYEVDGQTVDLSGVDVVLVEAGASATTDASGRFSFDTVPDGTYTVAIGPGATLPQAVMEDDGEDEDASGHPRVDIDGANGEVEIRLAIDGDRVVEWSMAHEHHRRAANRLDPEVSSDVLEGKVAITSRDDRERIKVEVEGLAEGDTIEVFFKAPADTAVFESAGTATADAEGEAEWKRDTSMGDALPGGATTVAGLDGFLVEVRDAATGDLLMSGVVPALPDVPVPGDDDDSPSFDDRAHGKDHLVSAVAGIEGEIAIERWPSREQQEFEMEAEGLAPGDEVVFEIEDPANPGSWIELATLTAGEDGGADLDYEDVLPLGVTDVEDLVGLDVRVTRAGETILSGEVPALVLH